MTYDLENIIEFLKEEIQKHEQVSEKIANEILADALQDMCIEKSILNFADTVSKRGYRN